MANPMAEQAVFTLGQAAKATGKSKGTISNAIRDGRLSVMSKDGGSYQIAASELFRVFPPNGSLNVQNEQSRTPEKDGLNRRLEVEVEQLRERLREKDERIAEIRAERDEWREQAKAATRLLEHHREKGAQTPAAAPGGFWARLLGRGA